MIFLSAQPDEVYFLWQLQLQIINFSSVGINKEDIHILIAYNPYKGLHPHFRDYIEQNKSVSFFIYEDTRVQKEYFSSIRPHIIAKHFNKYPYLENGTIFYHDSDIVFRELPCWSNLLQDDAWYASDTRSYLDSNYIITHAGEEIFSEMCRIVGVDPFVVQSHDNNAGGAQYILKKPTLTFWKKVESDSEKLFSFLKKWQNEDSEKNSENFQIWCADMWVVWWNALLENKEFLTSSQLDFAWANSPLQVWETVNILHYTGSCRTETPFFDKTKYQTHPPFYDDLSFIDEGSCSMVVVDMIKDYRKMLDAGRTVLSGTLFVVSVNNPSKETLSNLLTFCRFINRYFIVPVRIILNKEDVNTVHKIFDRYGMENVHITHNEELPDSSSMQFVWIFPPDVIISRNQIQSIYRDVSTNNYKENRYRYKTVKVDKLGRQIFSVILDNNYLEENKGKTVPLRHNTEISIFNRNGILPEVIEIEGNLVYQL